jgi:hypothetical protein
MRHIDYTLKFGTCFADTFGIYRTTANLGTSLATRRRFGFKSQGIANNYLVTSTKLYINTAPLTKSFGKRTIRVQGT